MAKTTTNVESARYLDFTIQGLTQLSWGREADSDKQHNESHAQWEARIWRERAHVAKVNGQRCCILPAINLKRSVESGAKACAMSIPGKGKCTFTAPMAAAFLPLGDAVIMLDGSPFLESQLTSITVGCDARGQKKATTRVMRTFPVIPAGWVADVRVMLNDDDLQQHWRAIHQFIARAGTREGIGRWRPGTGGLNGQYIVTQFAGLDATKKLIERLV